MASIVGCPVSRCHGMKTYITRDSTESLVHAFLKRQSRYGCTDRKTDVLLRRTSTDEPRGTLRNAPSPCESQRTKPSSSFFLPSLGFNRNQLDKKYPHVHTSHLSLDPSLSVLCVRQARCRAPITDPSLPLLFGRMASVATPACTFTKPTVRLRGYQ